MQVTCGTLGLSTATVKLIDVNGEEHIACSVGSGPVDAGYKAVDLIIKVQFKLTCQNVPCDSPTTLMSSYLGDSSPYRAHCKARFNELSELEVRFMV